MDKRHPPTAKRLKKAALDGQVVRSKLLMAAGILIAGLAIIIWHSPLSLSRLLSHIIGLSPVAAIQYASKAFLDYVIIPLVFISVVAILLSLSQGLRLKFECKFRFYNPCRGFIRNLVTNFVGSLVLIIVLIILLLTWVYSPPADLTALLKQPLRIIVCIAIIAGIADYFFERHTFLAGLYMTQQELLDELKEDEGDPHLRNYRSSIARELAYSEIVARVRRAKVILVERNK